MAAGVVPAGFYDEAAATDDAHGNIAENNTTADIDEGVRATLLRAHKECCFIGQGLISLGVDSWYIRMQERNGFCT